MIAAFMQFICIHRTYAKGLIDFAAAIGLNLTSGIGY
jgi:hypothetical protein